MGFFNTIPVVAQPEVLEVNETAISKLSLTDAKRWLGFNHDRFDADVTAAINTAFRRAEKYLNSDILSRDREVTYNRIEIEPIHLFGAPLTLTRDSGGDLTNFTIVSINGEGTETTLVENEDFKLIGGNDPRIDFKYAQHQETKITYTTSGLGLDDIGIGIRALVYDCYYNDNSPQGNWMKHLAPFKRMKFYGVR